MKNFDEFLQIKCAEENPTAMDDEMPDVYDNWFSELEVEEMYDYTNEFIKQYEKSI